MNVALLMRKCVQQARRFALLMFALLISVGFAVASKANGEKHYGRVHFPIACQSAVQEEFDLALAMLHTFSFPAAAKTFMAVAQKDPDCAMAFCGIAATAVGSLYGGRPGPMALEGEQAIEKAKSIGGKTTRERDYIATLEAFYKDAAKVDYATRVRRLCRCPLLGEMLLDTRKPGPALEAFEAALKREPSRFWSLNGAGGAAELSGDRAKATAHYAMLVGQSVSADIEQYPELTAARAFLETRQLVQRT
jgi:hypothetical protein